MFESISGSIAEFYIQPAMSCIGDIDTMWHYTHQMAGLENEQIHPHKFNKLHADTLFYAVQYIADYPGYVTIRKFGCMIFRQKLRCYSFFILDYQPLLSTESPPEVAYTIGGPALKSNLRVGKFAREYFDRNMRRLKNDLLFTFPCLFWPHAISDWPFRKRHHAWPTLETINAIFELGFNVVAVSHPDCKDDVFQWRVSFSRAEVILLNTWTPKQQMIYHMLRFFTKNELNKNLSESECIVKMYYLKTLMLWACEKQSGGWWKEKHYMEICLQILKALHKCLRTKQCSNYFVNNCNLLSFAVDEIHLRRALNRLGNVLTIQFLCDWFDLFYIRPVEYEIREHHDFETSKSFANWCRELEFCIVHTHIIVDLCILLNPEYVKYAEYMRQINPKLINFYDSCTWLHLVHLFRIGEAQKRFSNTLNLLALFGEIRAQDTFPIDFSTEMNLYNRCILKSDELFQKIGNARDKVIRLVLLEALALCTTYVSTQTTSLSEYLYCISTFANLHYAGQRYSSSLKYSSELSFQCEFMYSRSSSQVDIPFLAASKCVFLDHIACAYGFVSLAIEYRFRLIKLAWLERLLFMFSPDYYALHLTFLNQLSGLAGANKTTYKVTIVEFWRTIQTMRRRTILLDCDFVLLCVTLHKAKRIVLDYSHSKPPSEKAGFDRKSNRVQISPNDSLEDILVKHSVEQMTHFISLIANDEHCRKRSCSNESL